MDTAAETDSGQFLVPSMGSWARSIPLQWQNVTLCLCTPVLAASPAPMERFFANLARHHSPDTSLSSCTLWLPGMIKLWQRTWLGADTSAHGSCSLLAVTRLPASLPGLKAYNLGKLT